MLSECSNQYATDLIVVHPCKLVTILNSTKNTIEYTIILQNGKHLSISLIIVLYLRYRMRLGRAWFLSSLVFILWPTI